MSDKTSELPTPPDISRGSISWGVEYPHTKCPCCGGDTVLIVAPPHFYVDEESAEEIGIEFDDDPIEANVEITGGWCPKCEAILSVTVNIFPQRIAHKGASR